MIGQVVEIVEADRHVSLEYGNLVIKASGVVIGRVALSDILAVIVNPHGATLSAGALAALAERGTPVVISGPHFKPVAVTLPLIGHHAIARRIEAQVGASAPSCKQAWKQVVRSKISMQATVLEVFGGDADSLWDLESRVRSGDRENVEAQAARLYWPRLFSTSFRRNRDEPGINALLNYGYAVLRAATARAITASGLHPSIGIHHRNALDTMRLADDLMEPFRPLVDARVRGIVDSDEELEVTPRTKKMLVAVLQTDVPSTAGTTPVSVAMHRTARSLAEYFEGERTRLELPGPAFAPAVKYLSEAFL